MNYLCALGAIYKFYAARRSRLLNHNIINPLVGSLIGRGAVDVATLDARALGPATERRLAVALGELSDLGLDLGAEVTHETLDGPRGGLTEGTDGVALDLLGELEDHVDLTALGLASVQTVHHLQQPSGTLTAGGALAAGLVLEEVRQALDAAHDISLLVEHNDSSGTETTLVVPQIVEVHQNLVADALGQDGGRGTTRDDSLEVVPAALDTTAVALNELLEGDRHLLLNRAGLVHVAADAVQLGAGVTLSSKRVEPLGASAHDGGSNSNGLNVGNSGRASVKTNAGRERGLHTGLTGLALQTLNERGLLTAYVGAHTTVNVHIEVVARSARVLADKAGLVGLVDGLLEDNRLLVELTTDVDVGSSGVHGPANHETALNELVGVLAHDLSVLTGTGLTLIGVDAKVAITNVVLPSRGVHERPFHTGGETSASASSEVRLLGLVDDPVVALEHDLLGLVPVALAHGVLEGVAIGTVQILENAVLVLQTAVVQGARGANEAAHLFGRS